MENSTKVLDSKYILQCRLTETKHSKIFLGCEVENPRNIVTIKLIDHVDHPSLFETTLETQCLLSNEFVVKIVSGGSGAIVSKGKTSESKHYLVSDFAKNGELFDYILYIKKGFDEDISKILFLQVLSGLQYYSSVFDSMKSMKVRMENILLDENWRVKLTDYFIENLNANVSTDKLIFPLVSFNNTYPNQDLANILFSLLTGRKTNLQGKALQKKKVQLFWKSVNNTFKEIKFTDEYVDLLTKLLLNDNFDQYKKQKIDDKDKDENFYEKISHHPWFGNLSIDMINSNTNNIYEKVKKEFESRMDLVNEKRNNMQSNFKSKSYNCKKNSNSEIVYRSASNIINSVFFDHNIKCNFCKKNCKNFYSVEIANVSYENFDASYFMNELAHYCVNEIKKEKEIECSHEKCKFVLLFKEDDSELKIKISLDKSEQCYIINFYKIEGNIFAFYDVYEEILDGIDKILSY